MNTLRAAFVPGLIAGICSIFTSGIIMGGIFHRFQRETPETWKPEGPVSYTLASIFHIMVALGVACLSVLVIRFDVGVFSEGFGRHLLFGFCLWAALPLPMIVESAVFIRMHRQVVIGRLLDWLVTILLATVVTGWWLSK